MTIITPHCFRAISFFVCFFVCLFVSLSATLRENGWTDLHEIFREGVEWPWDDLIKFWVNSGKRVGGSNSKVNLLSPAIAQSQLHSLGGSRGRGLLCPAPRLVIVKTNFDVGARLGIQISISPVSGRLITVNILRMHQNIPFLLW